MSLVGEIKVAWTIQDISERKPDWDDEKCAKFLAYIKDQLLQATESAGNDTIDRVLDTHRS